MSPPAKPDAATSDKYFGPFHPSKFFLPGPAGYTATFFADRRRLRFQVIQSRSRSRSPAAPSSTTSTGPNHQEVFPAKDLAGSFPGIKRILREAHVRYAFERFGVPYVVVDPVLRPAAILAISVLQGGRSDRGEISAHAAHRRRHAAGHRHAAYRSHPAGGEIRLHLLQPRRSHSQYRLAQDAGPRRLSRLCATCAFRSPMRRPT